MLLLDIELKVHHTRFRASHSKLHWKPMSATIRPCVPDLTVSMRRDAWIGTGSLTGTYFVHESVRSLAAEAVRIFRIGCSPGF